MKSRLFAALALLSASASSQAFAHYISGYAVTNHANCGAANLPGTIAELQKFFASHNFPDDAQKNALWTDADVKMADWGSSHDYFESTRGASGFDGADSSLISYIASHGTTSGGRYTALAGGADAACNIRTTEMKLGDSKSRYLVLSTCQGLKIGTGDDPSRPGENPQVTWRNANQGLNCIFGYSNNMEDGDAYGEYFLEDLATSDDTLADAFFKASRRVSYGNVPAALCFGADDNAARQHLATAKRFTDEHYGQGGSAYRYDLARRLDDTFTMPQTTSDKAIPRVIKTSHRKFKHATLAKALLGRGAANFSQSASGKLAIYKSPEGTMTYDSNTGFIDWRKDESGAWANSPREITIKDDVVIRIARDFLQRKSLVADVKTELKPTYIISRGVSDAGGHPLVFGKIVVFHQRFSGLTPLASAGSIEVTVDASGEVSAMTATLIDATLLRLTEWADSNNLDLNPPKASALARLQRQFPGANLAVIESRVGYDVGDGSALEERSRLSLEVVVEVESGGYARRFAERVPL